MTKKNILLFALNFLLIGAAYADETILQLRMEENSFAPRTGTLSIVAPTNSTSPFGLDPDLAVLDTGLKVDAQWDRICGSNVFLAGGNLTGWLLGPIVEGNSVEIDVEDLHNDFRQIFGLGPGNVATASYVVLAGDFFVPTDGVAERVNCSSDIEMAEYAILWIFLWPNATTFADKGFYIGDVFYQTEIGIQHYYIYHSAQLF